MNEEIKVLRERWEQSKKEEMMLRDLYDSAKERTHRIFNDLICIYDKQTK